MTRRKRTVRVKVPGVATQPGAPMVGAKRKRRFELVEIGGPTQLDAWVTAGRALLEADPDSFRRHLMSAETIADLYVSDDPDRLVAERLPLLGVKGGEA